MSAASDPRPGPHTSPAALGRLMQAGTSERLAFDDAEMAAILRHQLNAPIEFDLSQLSPSMANKLRLLASGHGLLLNSFRALLLHDHPPVELLEIAKQFAKACHNHPDSPLPPEVASLLYYAAIVAAMLRCGRRITSMDDQTIAKGVKLLIDRPWMDPELLGLLRQWLDHVEGARP